MLYKRYSKTTFQILRSSTTITMRSSTANTELYVLKKQLKSFLSVETTQKESQESNAPTLIVIMNTFDLLSLRSKRPVKAGIYAQAAIKRGYCYSQNIYPKTCYYDFLTGSLYSRYPKFCVFISNMTGLFEDVSRIIFSIIQDFYNESAPAALKTASVVSYKSFGDLVRGNPHYHCIVLEGGIDEAGSFHHIPIKDSAKLTEVFRRRVIKLFVDRGLLDSRFALKILSWKHPGFSVDVSVSIPASSKKARVNLSQYIIRHSMSLQKILFARSNGTVIYKTKNNEYFKENK